MTVKPAYISSVVSALRNIYLECGDVQNVLCPYFNYGTDSSKCGVTSANRNRINLACNE